MSYSVSRSPRMPAFVWPLVAVAALFGMAASAGGGGGGSSLPLAPRVPVCPSFQQGCIQPPPGMVGWWSGDGSASDISGTGLNGTLEGGVRFTQGKVGQAFEFNGINGQVKISDSPTLRFGTGGLTVDAWIKAPPSRSDYQGIFGKEEQVFPARSIILRLNPEGKVEFAVTDCGTVPCGFGTGGSRQVVRSPSPVDDDTFHHIAGVRHQSGYELYVDGKLVATRDEPARDSDNSWPMFIGIQALFRTGSIIYPFKGIIDEVELFNRALTPSEIQAVYNAGSAGKCKPLTTAAAQSVAYDPGLGTLPHQQGFALDDSGTSAAPRLSGGVLRQGPTLAQQFWENYDLTLDFATTPYILEATIRVISSNYVPNVGTGQRAGYYLRAIDSAGREFSIGLSSNGIFVNTDGAGNPQQGVPLTPFNTTDDFHTYRLEIRNGVGSLFVDGKFFASTPVGGAAFPAGSYAEEITPNRVLFGSAAGVSQSETELRFFRSTVLSGAACQVVVPTVPAGFIHEVFATGTKDGSDLSFGPGGNLFVSNISAYGPPKPIYRVTADGNVSFFGNPIVQRGAVHSDGSGNVFVGGVGQVWRVSSDGSNTSSFASGGALANIVDLIPDGAGNLLATNLRGGAFSQTGTISRISPTGSVSNFAGGLPDGIYGMVFGPDGNLLVAQYRTGLVSKLSPAGAVITPAFASGLSGPTYLALSPGGPFGTGVFVSETSAGKVSLIDAAGNVTTFATGLSAPLGIAIGPDGNLYVSEYGKGRVLRIRPGGQGANSGLGGTTTLAPIIAPSQSSPPRPQAAGRRPRS